MTRPPRANSAQFLPPYPHPLFSSIFFSGTHRVLPSKIQFPSPPLPPPICPRPRLYTHTRLRCAGVLAGLKHQTPLWRGRKHASFFVTRLLAGLSFHVTPQSALGCNTFAWFLKQYLGKCSNEFDLPRQNCLSLRCIWSIASQRCPNYIFILD